jgi:transcription elongation factor Elf1
MEMTEATPQKTFKQICTCQNCGNEAEMIVTCSLEPVEEAFEAQVAPGGEPQSEKKQVPGHATCTHCGNEAEILVDIG